LYLTNILGDKVLHVFSSKQSARLIETTGESIIYVQKQFVEIDCCSYIIFFISRNQTFIR